MLDREDCIKLDQILRDSNTLLALLEKLQTLDPRSEEYQRLVKEFDELFDKTNEEHRELDKKSDVKKFMSELNLRDVEPEREQILAFTSELEKPLQLVEKKEPEKQKELDILAITDFVNREQPIMKGTKTELLVAKNIKDENLRNIKEIGMGQKPDYMGGTKLSLGTGQRFHGVLGEIKESMQLLRGNLDTKNMNIMDLAKVTDAMAKVLTFVGAQNQSRNNFNPMPKTTIKNS